MGRTGRQDHRLYVGCIHRDPRRLNEVILAALAGRGAYAAWDTDSKHWVVVPGHMKDTGGGVGTGNTKVLGGRMEDWSSQRLL